MGFAHFLLAIVYLKFTAMRLNVFLRTYGLLILLAMVLFFRLSNGFTPFQLFVAIALVVSALLAILLNDNIRYVQSFSVRDGKLHITYLNRFLQYRSVELPATAEVKFSRRFRLSALWLPALDITADGEWMGFYIPSNKLYNDIRDQLAAANIALAK